ncbi:MAG TPA: O-antigen ligase family protein [Aequorivita sp.]|nr:O-antigen ligase family protein [Aequorivita sp.]
MRIPKKKITVYLYTFLLTAMSGNPLFSISSDTSKYVFIAFVLLLVAKHHTYFNINKGIVYYRFFGFFAIIFLFQKLVLGFVSVPSTIAFMARITLGYIIIRHIGHNFKYAFFQIIFIVSLISLFGFAWNAAGMNIPAISVVESTSQYSDNSSRNMILFNQHSNGDRNSGMFWEPGAFACYICLAFLFYLGNIRTLIKLHKWKVIIILVALITTFSTTGYIVLFIIGIATIYIEYKKKYGAFILPILIVFGLIAYITYENTDFMKEKMTTQVAAASQRDKGEFAPDRMSAILFDLHYIKKHPLIGNGFHASTRFADHPSLQEEDLGHGNGFSNFLASMGVLSFLFYLFYIIRYNKNHAVLFVLCIIVLLQGEPLLNYSLFLSLPFIFIFEKKRIKKEASTEQDIDAISYPENLKTYTSLFKS